MKLVVLLLGVLVVSCAVPYYERAEVTPGLTGGAGVGAGAGYRDTGGSTEPWESDAPLVSLQGTAFLRYGLRHSVSLFGQLTGGCGLWLMNRSAAGSIVAFPVDIQIGTKVHVGQSGAVRVNLVAPDLNWYAIRSFPLYYLEAAYLNDFSPEWTGTVGLGARGISVAATNHFQTSPGVLRHISMTLTGIPNVTHPWVGLFVGVGWEFMRNQEEW